MHEDHQDKLIAKRYICSQLLTIYWAPAVAIITTLSGPGSGLASLASSMHSLVLNGEPISVSKVSLFTHYQLFHTKPDLLTKPYRVESRV
jgi:hypothetical protein